MSTDPIPVSINILDKEYRIACAVDEREALLESARYLDQKMREVRDTGRIIGADRIAVMVALNMAHELLQSHHVKDNSSRDVSRRIRGLQEKIEVALNSGNKLEL